MTKNKKPTMMEVKTAINNLIHEIARTQKAVQQINQTLSSYIEFTGKGDKFSEWILKRIEEIQNDESGDNKSKNGTIRSSDSKDRGTTGGKTDTASKDKVVRIKKSKKSTRTSVTKS